jgi:hypothetical protein
MRDTRTMHKARVTPQVNTNSAMASAFAKLKG